MAGAYLGGSIEAARKGTSMAVSFFDRASTVAPPGYNRFLIPPAALAMHLSIVAIGVFIVLIIAVHLVFKVIKFTIGIFLLGLALFAVLFVFQRYLGIDLLTVIGNNL